MKIDRSRQGQMVQDYCRQHQLSPEFAFTAQSYYLPLVEHLLQTKPEFPVVLAISGSQGSGKSTLAHFLDTALTLLHGWRVANLSIDDFYLTRAQRNRLAETVHPLLQTRGVPGTHDVPKIQQAIAALRRLKEDESVAVPVFDKLQDDRCPETQWTHIRGPVHLILFEGWCLGALPQTQEELKQPINRLEEECDGKGNWRRWVNQQLKSHYQDLWGEFDALVFLKVPDFSSVLNWRHEQEQRLVEAAGFEGGGMTAEQMNFFIQHYQRITEANLRTLPGIADLVFYLDPDHRVSRADYRHVFFSD